MSKAWAELLKCIAFHDFGKNGESVVEALLAHEGNASRDEIHKHTKLEDEVVRRTIAILVQHRIVSCRRQVNAAPKSSVKQDFVAPDPLRWLYVLHACELRYRLLAPRYITIIRAKMGQEAELVVETLVQHGLLSANQIVELCVARLPSMVETNTSEQTAAGFSDATHKTTRQVGNTRQIKLRFEALTSEGYLEEAPLVDTLTGAPIVKDVTEPSKKRQKVQTGGPDPMLFEDKTTLWQLNHEKFIFDLRNLEVVEYVTTVINPTAGTVVGMLLQQYPQDRIQIPKPVQGGAILAMCSRNENVPTLTKTILDSYIEEMTSEQANILIESAEGFTINIKGIFEKLEVQHVQSIVSDRMEPLAGRVYRLLVVYKRLEENQVAEFGTAPLKDIRRVLHALYQHGFATMQEIPRAGNSDRNPTRQFYLWGVPLGGVKTMLMDQFMATWCKLRVRLRHEQERIKFVQDKAEAQEPLTADDEKEFVTWKKGDDRLSRSMMHVDKLMMVFRDFCEPPRETMS